MVRQAELLVDLNKIKENISNIERNVIPIVKANAYGTGIEGMFKVIEELEINIVGVAIVDEGIKLRSLGYQGSILIINQPFIEEIPAIIENNITAGVCSLEFMRELNKYNAKVHVEIDTGMGRTGVQPNEVDNFLQELNKLKNIEVEGIYTHFATIEYAKNQIEVFKTIISKFKDLKYIHASSSAGTINNIDNLICNYARPGIMLYEDATKLKTKISYIKEVEVGTSISYGRTYIADKKRTIGTIPLGYADGIKRTLSNNGNVVINDKLAPIVGVICMDSFMVDLTDIAEAEIGMDVYIWDNKNITLNEIADRCNTINYEILSTISSRVPRKYEF